MYPDPEQENIELLTDLTHSSIDEWQTKLVNATNGNWQMFILEYEWSEHATAYVEEFPHCTIFVNYIHLTADESVGRTGWDFSKSDRYYYWIEVDTHTIENRVQIELNETGGKVWSEEVIMELPENDLRNIILHEFGHALGVEHYYITTNCIKEECDYSPIMFSSVDLFEGVVKNVTEKDLLIPNQL